MNFDLVKSFGKSGGVVVMLALILAMVVFGPLLVIWSINTLFPAVNIGYGFDTWCAVVLLHAFFSSAIKLRA